MAGASVGDSIGLLQLGAAVGRGTTAVCMEYHGGLGGIGIENTMVGGVVVYWVESERLRRISTREYVEIWLRCALVKRLFEILNPGVVKGNYQLHQPKPQIYSTKKIETLKILCKE